MKCITDMPVVRRNQMRWILCAVFLFSVFGATSQVTLAFQGGEPGDTWGYTSSGASAIAQAETTSSQNYVSGSSSIVTGGNTGGGNCWAGGSGNGPAVARQFTFNSLDISSSNESVRTLTFNWGNRHPVCNGTGWDAGENLTFTPYIDGSPQAPVTLATGNNNAAFDIDNNQYTYSIPACVNQFYFVVSVTTNRSDELLFLDDVRITAPQLNPTTVQPSPISGATNICGGIETYSVTQVPGAVYTWSGLPPGASFTTPNGTASSHVITVDWGTAPAGTYLLTVTPSNSCVPTPDEGTPQTISVTIGNALTPVTISGPTEICPGATIVLSSSYASGNVWSPGNETTPTINVTGPGTYSVTISTGCGTVTDSHTVTASPAPVATIIPGGPTAICPGDAVLLTASGGNSYQWSNGPATAAITVTSPGTYTVTVTNACGTDAASVTVTESPLPDAQIAGALSFCAGSSTTLTASGGNSYQWANGPATAAITVTSPGTYTVTVTNACGTDAASVTVTESPLPDAQIAGTLSFCAGSSTTLMASGGNSYQWSNGPATAAITVTSPGTYTVAVTNACGSDAVSVTVTESAVNAGFTASAVTGNAPAEITFTNTSLPPAAAFDWDFDDGSGSSAVHPIHVFTSAGVYTVTLTAETADGCSDVASLLITITQEPASLDVPNVFTPNGDGTNDVFAVSAERIEKYHILICNRWGNTVTESDDILMEWDGTLGGEPVSEGTYFYRIAATGMDGRSYDTTGFFELIR